MSTQFKLREVGFQVRYINSYSAFSSKLFTQSAVLFTPDYLYPCPRLFSSHISTLWDSSSFPNCGKKSREVSGEKRRVKITFKREHQRVGHHGQSSPNHMLCLFVSRLLIHCLTLCRKNIKINKSLQIYGCVGAPLGGKLNLCVCFLVFLSLTSNMLTWSWSVTKKEYRLIEMYSTLFPLSGVQPVLERRPQRQNQHYVLLFVRHSCKSCTFHIVKFPEKHWSTFTKMQKQKMQVRTTKETKQHWRHKIRNFKIT